MSDNAMLTDAQMQGTIDKAKQEVNVAAGKKIRNFLLVGCGDGGCNIASQIHQLLPETYVVAYNTSARAMDAIQADIKIIPAEEDGSGKARDYSKEVFKAGSYKHLLSSVQQLTEKMVDLEYIIVTTTCDGGTGGGVSPMIAKFLEDNVGIPVILLGVYPSLEEDAVAQYNAMSWQQEVEESHIPYIVFDNTMVAGNKFNVHYEVNRMIANAMLALSGNLYGETNISSIDNRDMYMLLSRIGGRISVYTTTQRPTVSQDFDEYLENLVNQWPEPKPYGVSGVGLFLKAPADIINRTDTSLSKFMSRYGASSAKYLHLETSHEFSVSLICTGCTEPSDRIYQMRQRYEDIQANLKWSASQAANALNGIESPFGSNHRKQATKKDAPDLSALGL